ncbi:hypothetical protein CEP52_004163 [Fusarium oligoseptatum]|uniref:Uncharacterized protein n=2 Tax=Fusarium solani species complex TaxID=232080 RepID=A0A428U4Z2_9HYPO|nr:hypothetical protein CEP51_001283 [Fusarium floridanum]RSM09345.1 hypothetical protein CEP52_004163 [Fusarium oligoseptatum]
MNEEDNTNLVQVIKFIVGIDGQGNSEPRVVLHSGPRVAVFNDSRVEGHSGSRLIEYSSSEAAEHSGSEVVELADFYIDFPEAEMSMNPEDITWPAKLEGPTTCDYLVQKYAVAVKNLQKYLRNIDALTDHLARETVTFSTGRESATELTERLAKDKQHAKNLVHAIREFLAKAEEQAEEEAVTNRMREMSLSKDS